VKCPASQFFLNIALGHLGWGISLHPQVDPIFLKDIDLNMRERE